MQHSENIDALLAMLHEVQRHVEPPNCTGFNAEQKYDYATEVDWWQTLHALLTEYKLVVVFSLADCSCLGPTPRGTQMITQVKLKMRIIHAPTDQWLEIETGGYGADPTDKGIYKAITGAKKYGYAMLLALPTLHDPERDSQGSAAKQSPSDPPAVRAINAIHNAQSLQELDRIMEHAQKVIRKASELDQISRAANVRICDIADAASSSGDTKTLQYLKARVEVTGWITEATRDILRKFLADGPSAS